MEQINVILEDSLGVALIYRSTRKLTLTREGHRLLAAAHKMLEAVEGELVDLSVSATAPSGELRVTVPSVLSKSHFTEQIAAFSKAHPRIKLSLDFSDIRRDLIDAGFDIAIRMGPKAKATRTALQAMAEQKGVCRDFAHLAIALCRCMNIPARYCTGYLSDTGEPLPHPPGDFAAWMEVFLSGEWHMFDPRNNKPRFARILIARGRDATDVPLTQTFGQYPLTEFKVWTDELA
ncbi:hypothetical protein SuNHUV7_27100 (plasmid) [Pseudoseohaeicola sp. NH-UV-7]